MNPGYRRMGLNEFLANAGVFYIWVLEGGRKVVLSTPTGDYVFTPSAVGEPGSTVAADYSASAPMEWEDFRLAPEDYLVGVRASGTVGHIVSRGGPMFDVRAQIRMTLASFQVSPEGFAEAVRRSGVPGILVVRHPGQPERVYELTWADDVTLRRVTDELPAQMDVDDQATVDDNTSVMASWAAFREDPGDYLEQVRASRVEGYIVEEDGRVITVRALASTPV